MHCGWSNDSYKNNTSKHQKPTSNVCSVPCYQLLLTPALYRADDLQRCKYASAQTGVNMGLRERTNDLCLWNRARATTNQPTKLQSAAERNQRKWNDQAKQCYQSCCHTLMQLYDKCATKGSLWDLKCLWWVPSEPHTLTAVTYVFKTLPSTWEYFYSGISQAFSFFLGISKLQFRPKRFA